MILSRGRRYLFVHIPKTGGTSLARALEGRAMKDDVMLGDTPKAQKRRHKATGGRGRLWKHSTLADLDGLVGLDELPGLFSFTLVRNPWDRMVSYYHWLRGQSFDHPSVRLAAGLSFDAFAGHPHTVAAWSAAPARHYMTAVNGQEYCDAYIRLEQFARDAAPLWDHLGFRLELARENRSARRAGFRDYYSAASRRAVYEAAREDIERFGYTF